MGTLSSSLTAENLLLRQFPRACSQVLGCQLQLNSCELAYLVAGGSHRASVSIIKSSSYKLQDILQRIAADFSFSLFICVFGLMYGSK